jgi:molybdate transport system substrate-binding protein
MKKSGCRLIVSFLISILFLSLPAFAEEKITAGVAANYIQTFKELSAAFEAKTGIKVEATFTSSGTLYSQVTNGAPYDIFLSADEERPARLYKEGFVEKPFTYATGQVILWSAKKDFCKAKDWTLAIKNESIKKIAIANPETAPYGMAALKALQKTGLYDSIKPKLVNSQDIAQAFQYASTEAVDAGFCAFSAFYSEKGKTGCYYKIKEAPVVVQSACVLKSSKNIKSAQKFAAFLVSKEAVKIKEKYGYK